MSESFRGPQLVTQFWEVVVPLGDMSRLAEPCPGEQVIEGDMTRALCLLGVR